MRYPSLQRRQKEVIITTTAQALASELHGIGTEDFFLFTGGDNSIWIALREAGIRQIVARSEASAVYMADAYARLRGRPTFVYGQAGPGAANVAGALAEPFWSASPVVAMPTTMRRRHRYRGEYQDLAQLELFASVTKWRAEASLPAQVPSLIRGAARHAISGTPGPVYLGIPSDLLEEDVPGYLAPEPPSHPLEGPLTRPAPTLEYARAAVAALLKARRPVILVGNGIHMSVAYQPLLEVAERLHIPVATSSAGKGSIPDTHELALGTVGRYSRSYANGFLLNADVILAIGTQLGGLVTDSFRLIRPETYLIHVTVDPDAIGQNFRTDLGIVADASIFLQAMLDELVQVPALSHESDNMAELVRERGEWRQRRSILASSDGTGGTTMRPEAVMGVIDRLLPADAILVADTGYAAAWTSALVERQTSGHRYLRADGSLGWAFPGSLGAQLAVPDKPVICVSGDGGFGYHIGEIETALRLDLPVVVVVLDNQSLAFEAHIQTNLYKTLVPEVDNFRDVDYAQVARAFGASGYRVTTATDLGDALAAGLERRTLTVIDAVVDRSAIAPVTRYDSVRKREL